MDSAPPPYTASTEKQGYPPPGPTGYAPPGPPGYPPQNQAPAPTGYPPAPYMPSPVSQQPNVNTTVVQQQAQYATPVATTVVVSGGCPNCRVGVMQDSFTCCGICLGICFFPIGLICCFLMTEKKCSNCGASFH